MACLASSAVNNSQHLLFKDERQFVRDCFSEEVGIFISRVRSIEARKLI